MSAGAKPSEANGKPYDWQAIEPRWQAAWRASATFAAPELPDGQQGIYIFAAPPFTSGSAHIGHIRSYTIADAYARFRRARGDPVLLSMGFDSFGLPSELGAIRSNMHPQQWVEDCCRRMRGQFDAMGFSFDWSRTFVSSDEDLYRWSQWLFLSLLDRDLVYQKQARIDWCDSCNTVLARSQVEDGCCWRCGNSVRLVSRLQWFLRASAYFSESDERLDALVEFDQNALGSQRAVLGKVEGVELDASTIDGLSITVFTADLTAISTAAFVAIAPSHPEVDAWILDESIKNRVEGLRSGGWTRSERKPEEVVAIPTGLHVTVPGVPRMLPVLISAYVEPRFGPSAILGIPHEDPTARAIADGLSAGALPRPRVAEGTPKARRAVRFSAADFPISRQRAWGAPIPLVHCPKCGTVPVSVDDLPVRLPKDLRITGSGNALAEHPDFSACSCPVCDGPAERDTDTLDCHVDGLWMWMPFCVPPADRSREMFTHSEFRRWVPVHQIVWGVDGGTYILSQRTMAKMLRDGGMLEHLPDGEPFVRAIMHGMVEQDGQKMSKHLGNVVDPDDLVQRVGADTVRLAALHGAAPRNAMKWTEHELEFCHKFLTRLWRYTTDRLDLVSGVSASNEIDRSDKLRSQLAKWCTIATRKITDDLMEMQMHRAARNLIRMLARIEDYETRVIQRRGALDARDSEALGIALRLLIQMVAPLTPHMAEELWAAAGNSFSVSNAPWPTAEARPAQKAYARAGP